VIVPGAADTFVRTAACQKPARKQGRDDRASSPTVREGTVRVRGRMKIAHRFIGGIDDVILISSPLQRAPVITLKA
jgi:hypothetical protein